MEVRCAIAFVSKLPCGRKGKRPGWKHRCSTGIRVSPSAKFTGTFDPFTGGTISAPGEPEYVDGRQISAGLIGWKVCCALVAEASPGARNVCTVRWSYR